MFISIPTRLQFLNHTKRNTWFYIEEGILSFVNSYSFQSFIRSYMCMEDHQMICLSPEGIFLPRSYFCNCYLIVNDTTYSFFMVYDVVRYIPTNVSRFMWSYMRYSIIWVMIVEFETGICKWHKTILELRIITSIL